MVNKKKSKEKRIKKVPEYRSLTERKEEVKKIAIQKKEKPIQFVGHYLQFYE